MRITHPEPRIVEGLRLAGGAVLKVTDLYASSAGSWEPCPIPGLALEVHCDTVWVRPGAKLSDVQQKLLMYLAGTSKSKLYDCVSWSVSGLEVVSSYWSEDPRLSRITLKIGSRGDLRALSDFGFMYETWPDRFVITDDGREYSKIIRSGMN